LITQVLGLSATLLAAVFLFPQIASLIWERDTRGVSMTWAIFGVVTNAAWVAYLLQEGLWLPSFAPATAVVTYGLLAVVLAQLGARHRWGWGLGYSAALALVGLLGGTPALGAVLVVTPAIQLAPEIAAVYRHPYPRGVSPSTWGLGAAEAVCWGGYGLLVGDLALVGYGLVTSAGSTLILARRWTTRTPRQVPRPRSATSTRPSLIAVAAASPRLAAVSFRRMLDT